jgi:single-strand DNA-binding protein
MPNYNKVLLMGNLTRDPELRFTTSGAPVTNLRIAVNRVFTDGSGERKEETCFLTVVVWGRQAESCAEYLTKGRPVFVEGRLRTRSFQTEDEKNRTILEVVADRVQFLGRRKVESDSSATGAEAKSDEEKSKRKEDVEEKPVEESADEKTVEGEESTEEKNTEESEKS